MSRTVATVWHASLSTLAALLYFLFVLPRWWELTGFSPHVLGIVMRVIVGALIGLTALPVATVLRRARQPEHRTPELALSLLRAALVAPVAAGTLIALTAISEIWLSLDQAGMWLFGIYGAAAAIALLGIGAFYLASVAESPPPPPKPIQPKAEKQPKTGRRWGKKSTAESVESAEADEDGDEPDADPDATETADTDEESANEAEGTEDSADEAKGAEDEGTASASAESAALRPTGKRRAKKAQ